MRVGLTYDLDARNTECSVEATAIAHALRNLGNDVVMIGSATQLIDKLAAGDHYDLVFNCCRKATTIAGQAHVPTVLDVYDTACTGSSPATLQICNQRSIMKSLLRDRGIPTSDYWLVETLGDITRVDAAYPATVGSILSCSVVKPLVASDANELSKACCQVMSHGTAALIEPQLAGKSLCVAILGNGASATCLMPSDVNPAWCNAIERTVQAAWQTVGGCDAGCMTLLCDNNGQPHVMSIEPMPSLAVDSSLMSLAQASGLTLDDVVGRIVRSAAQRAGLETLRPHLNQAAKLANSDKLHV